MAVCSKCGAEHEKTHRNRTRCQSCTVVGKTIQSIFWMRVNKNGKDYPYDDALGKCWEWTATLDAYGYGAMKFQNKRHKAHRLSWSLHNGDISSDIHVMHKCDNPRCVNPDHLITGTHHDNMMDMVKKKRYSTKGFVCRPKKRRHKNADAIMECVNRGEKKIDIVRRFGVHRGHLWKIINAESSAPTARDNTQSPGKPQQS